MLSDFQSGFPPVISYLHTFLECFFFYFDVMWHYSSSFLPGLFAEATAAFTARLCVAAGRVTMDFLWLRSRRLTLHQWDLSTDQHQRPAQCWAVAMWAVDECKQEEKTGNVWTDPMVCRDNPGLWKQPFFYSKTFSLAYFFLSWLHHHYLYCVNVIFFF